MHDGIDSKRNCREFLKKEVTHRVTSFLPYEIYFYGLANSILSIKINSIYVNKKRNERNNISSLYSFVSLNKSSTSFRFWDCS